MIHVIPFTADPEPSYLPLLSRGLSDLSVLWLNTAQIEAQVNLDLKAVSRQPPAASPAQVPLRNGQELWLSGAVKYDHGLIMEWYLYDPDQGKTAYYARFKAAEARFMKEWLNHLKDLITRFQGVEAGVVDKLAVTNSLPAFLEYRKGLELLSQAKTKQLKEQGLENLLTAVAYDADFFEAIDVLLLFALQNNQPDDFTTHLNLLERLRHLAKGYPRILLVMAELYWQLHNLVQTEQLLSELVAGFPDFAEGWIRLALYYHSTQRQNEALVTLQNLLDRDSQNLVALDLMGAIYAGMGERALAKQAWLKVLQLDSSRVNVLNNLGLLAEEDKEPNQAESFYQQAITVNNQWWVSYYNYGAFCRRQGRLDEAVLWFEKAGQLNGNEFQIFYYWALTLFELERFSEAQEVLLHLLKIAPDNLVRQQSLEMLSRFNLPEVTLGLKLCQLEKVAETTQSLALITAMLKLGFAARKNWFYWYLWGKVAMNCKHSRLARVFWEQGLKFGPKFPLLKSLGLYYWETKQFRKALPLFKQAYQFHHHDRDLCQAYLQTLIYLGEGTQSDIQAFLGDQAFLDESLPE